MTAGKAVARWYTIATNRPLYSQPMSVEKANDILRLEAENAHALGLTPPEIFTEGTPEFAEALEYLEIRKPARVSTMEIKDDHIPLNNAELLKLLAEADDLPDDSPRLWDIQERLGTAIPGMTCPQPTKGPVADRLSQLDRLFVRSKQARMLLDRDVIAQFQTLTS